MITSTGLSPNERAEQLIGRDYISHSAIATYSACPLKFFFRYVEGLPEETVSSSLVFGSSIHSAIQFHFEEMLVGNPAPSLATLLSVYHDAWSSRQDQEIRFSKGQDLDSLSDLAGRMLSAFQGSEIGSPTGTNTILGIEEEIRGPLVPGCPDLLARLDLIVDTGDVLKVVDFKSAPDVSGRTP